MYDLAIIGLGPAGLEAAQIAIKNNLNVIAFEDNELGGTCLNVGCIPTKSILYTSQLLKEVQDSSKLGLSIFSTPGYNWQAILDRKIEIVNKFNKLLHATISKNLTLVKAKAELNINYDNLEIYADDNVYQAKNILVCTGSKPIELPGLPFDGKFVVNSDDLFKMHDLPKKIAIVGSGAIGLEWAKILSDFGVQVRLIEKAPALAPVLDIELQKRVERILKQNKIEYFKNDFITSISNDLITLNSGVAFDTDCILVAIGRKPNFPLVTISGCAEEYKLKPHEDGTCDIDNLYIVGDALGKTMLAHSASHQARIIMNKILFNTDMVLKDSPAVIYINPEIASIGIREQDIENKEEYTIKKILISAIAKSWCDNAQDGLIKLIIKDDLIVGAHIVSKEASALISMVNIFIDQKIPIAEIENMIFPHPSFAEAIQEVIKNG
ncbi:MAG: NAD(P)/FAD-dependent oxidoreductase [Candidatus Gastranaerophilales bacterium]|nr:NAD(P)/FAD-dependent oxidoreductase [Candidatus Gastranaerophilales bacterium]